MSFVDEPCIRMVNERLLGRRLQDVKGEKVLVSCLVLAFCFSAARHSLRDFKFPDGTHTPCSGGLES